MTDLNLVVSYQATQLQTNFNEIKEAVRLEVEKYSLEVTDENIPEAKKAMANFNKVKADISDKFNQYIKALSVPIDELKSQKKEIEAIITDGRTKIADEVAKFEASKLSMIKEQITTYINEICKQKEISPQIINSDEFVKLTAVTTSGSLAKATKEAIDAKIMLIENEILKAKLEAEEKARREEEIAQNARREAEARAEHEKAEIEAKAKQREAELLARAELEKAEAVEKAKREATLNDTPKIAPRQDIDGKVIYTIRATFEVKSSIGANHEILCQKIAQMLLSAGINNCTNLEVLNA